jgi:hypothetical protein
VCTIQTLRSASVVQEDAAASWLVGSYDGVIGWGALGWMVLMLLAYAIATTRRATRAA